jgi:hypothetical protein
MGVISTLVVKLSADMTELVSASQESREHLKHIETSAKSVEGALGSLKEFAIDTGKALVGAFAAERIVEGLKAGLESTIAYAKELRDLRDQTGTNVVALQALTTETSDYGVSAQQTANLIFQLSQRIAGGDQSATAAFGRMGVSIDELKAKAPDQMFIATVSAVNNIENPLLRAGAAADLFGAKAGAAVQRLPRDFGEAVARNREFNSALGEDAVNAAARWEASVDKLETTLKNFSGNTLAPLLEKMAKFATTTTDIFNAAGNVPATPALDAGKFKVGDVNDKLKDLGPGGTTFSFGGNPVDATTAIFGEQAANALKALREQLKPLTEDQRKFIEQLFDMNQLTLENAKAFNINAAQIAAFKKEEDDIIETQRLNAETLKAQTHAYNELNVSAAKAETELTGLAMKRLEVYNALRQSILDQGRAAQVQLNDRGLGGPANQSPFDQALATRDRGYKDIEIQRDTLAKSKGGVTSDEVMAFQAMAAKVEADFDAATAKIRAGGAKVGDGLGAVSDTTHMGARQVGDAFSSFQGVIVAGTQAFSAAVNPSNNAEAAQRRNMENLMGYGGLAYNSTLSVGPMRRAAGGSVSAGQPYWVGDGGGPELFVPSAAGSIMPHGATGGGGDVHVALTVNGVIDATGRQMLAGAVKASLEETLRQRKWPSA